MADLALLTVKNADRWANAKATRDASGVARRLVSPSAKARYQSISQSTGVPWFVIAVIHERESSQDWGASLAQGDPWNRVSVHKPSGRGPFNSFERAAVDALVDCDPHAASWKDWSAGGSMTLLERYNGLGYAARGLPSPYIWAGTDQYVKGKFVADGVYDPNEVDKQLGCAVILKSMMALDPSIVFGGATKSAPTPVPTPTKAPVKESILTVIVNAVLSLFRKKS